MLYMIHQMGQTPVIEKKRGGTENNVMIGKNIALDQDTGSSSAPLLVAVKLGKLLNFFEFNVLICKMRINTL